MNLENEIWKNVPSYEGLYQVSNLGRIKSLGNERNRKEKILSLSLGKNGYYRIMLCKNGQKFQTTIQRVICLAFGKLSLEDFQNYKKNHLDVDHIDNNPANNHIDNLQVLNHWENVAKRDINGGPNKGKKLSEETKSKMRESHKKYFKPVICEELNKEFSTACEAARELGLRSTNITACCKGKLKTTGKYHFRYKEAN